MSTLASGVIFEINATFDGTDGVGVGFGIEVGLGVGVGSISSPVAHPVPTISLFNSLIAVKGIQFPFVSFRVTCQT